MSNNNTSETPKPETTPPPLTKRRPKLSDLTKLREQIERDAYRHMRTHQQLRTLLMNLMEISADVKNGFEESSQVLRTLNLTPTNHETAN